MFDESENVSHDKPTLVAENYVMINVEYGYYI